MQPFKVSSFYQFIDLSALSLEDLKVEIEHQACLVDLGGLIILAQEGLNGTVCAPSEQLNSFLDYLRKSFGVENANIKYAESEKAAFPRFKVRIRQEIVTTGVENPPSLFERKGKSLTPEEWHQVLSSNEDYALIDTRNWYETDLGVFKSAIDPRLINFQQFPDFVKNSGINKNKKVLMYCTGGIRCEKASLLMEDLGYEQVYQLQGGILKYLEQYPQGHYEGECFVFDQRVAVDGNLLPTERYSLCPHSGQPAEHWIECENCGKQARVSVGCLNDPTMQTCSKNCANIVQRKISKQVNIKAE